MQNYFSFTKVVLLGTLFLVAGCTDTDAPTASDSAQTDSPPVTLANTHCPVSGGKAKDTITVEWDGKTVGFCCAPCIADWEKLSDEEKAAKLAEDANDDGAEEGHEHEGSDHKHSS